MKPTDQKIKSDKRKAEIIRILTSGVMHLNDIRAKMAVWEENPPWNLLRSTLYNMCCDGILIREGKKNDQNSKYSLASQQPKIELPKIKGLGKARRMLCDDPRNIEIMKSTPLRKLPNNTVSGSSLNI